MKWRKRRMTSSVIDVPACPGLYAIARASDVLGLEETREYVYIGMSMNLNRRLKDHHMDKQRKPEFKEYLIKHSKEIWCWYAIKSVEKDELLSLEAELIDTFKPRFNDTI